MSFYTLGDIYKPEEVYEIASSSQMRGPQSWDYQHYENPDDDSLLGGIMRTPEWELIRFNERVLREKPITHAEIWIGKGQWPKPIRSNTPIVIQNGMVIDGNHRLASALTWGQSVLAFVPKGVVWWYDEMDKNEMKEWNDDLDELLGQTFTAETISLGLFNWTSDLSDEPEYPPFFDNLKNSHSGRGLLSIRGNEECIIWIDGGGEFDSTEIGSIEYLDSLDSLRIDAGVYLVLTEGFMQSWLPAYKVSKDYVMELKNEDSQYRGNYVHEYDKNYWNRYKPAVKEKFEKDPGAWCLATTGFTTEQLDDNFVFSDEEERYVCINPDWNAKAVEILTAQSPSLMRKFNDCVIFKRIHK